MLCKGLQLLGLFICELYVAPGAGEGCAGGFSREDGEFSFGVDGDLGGGGTEGVGAAFFEGGEGGDFALDEFYDGGGGGGGDGVPGARDGFYGVFHGCVCVVS